MDASVVTIVSCPETATARSSTIALSGQCAEPDHCGPWRGGGGASEELLVGQATSERK